MHGYELRFAVPLVGTYDPASPPVPQSVSPDEARELAERLNRQTNWYVVGPGAPGSPYNVVLRQVTGPFSTTDMIARMETVPVMRRRKVSAK